MNIRPVAAAASYASSNEMPQHKTDKTGDAINAGQLLTIESGELTISAADDAIHCDYTLQIGAEGTDGPAISIDHGLR